MDFVILISRIIKKILDNLAISPPNVKRNKEKYRSQVVEMLNSLRISQNEYPLSASDPSCFVKYLDAGCDLRPIKSLGTEGYRCRDEQMNDLPKLANQITFG